jgi:hypothetical protein
MGQPTLPKLQWMKNEIDEITKSQVERVWLRLMT